MNSVIYNKINKIKLKKILNTQINFKCCMDMTMIQHIIYTTHYTYICAPSEDHK